MAFILLALLCKQVMPAVVNVTNEAASLVTLIKPQFEARRSQARIFSKIFLTGMLSS